MIADVRCLEPEILLAAAFAAISHFTPASLEIFTRLLCGFAPPPRRSPPSQPEPASRKALHRVLHAQNTPNRSGSIPGRHRILRVRIRPGATRRRRTTTETRPATQGSSSMLILGPLSLPLLSGAHCHRHRHDRPRLHRRGSHHHPTKNGPHPSPSPGRHSIRRLGRSPSCVPNHLSRLLPHGSNCLSQGMAQ